MNSRGERISGSRSCQRMAAADLTFNNSSGAGIGRMALAIVCCGRRKFVKINYFNILSGEGCLSGPSPPPLAHCKPENRSLAGPFSLCAKGVCRSHPPFGDWPAARDRSPNAHRLFPPAPRSRRDGFTISIHFNELTGSRCARVSLVPGCLKADGDATRAAWWLVCLGSFSRSL